MARRLYAADEPRPTRGQPPRLSGDEIVSAVRLATRGRSVRAIAQVLSTSAGRAVSPATVARWLRRVRQPQEDVQMALASLRAEAVESWAGAMRTGTKYGRHAPAKDLLMATGTIERDTPSERITIIVGDGTAPIGRLPDTLQRGPIAALPPPSGGDD